MSSVGGSFVPHFLAVEIFEVVATAKMTAGNIKNSKKCMGGVWFIAELICRGAGFCREEYLQFYINLRIVTAGIQIFKGLTAARIQNPWLLYQNGKKIRNWRVFYAFKIRTTPDLFRPSIHILEFNNYTTFEQTPTCAYIQAGGRLQISRKCNIF
jgi:hypothetical protein